jgi:hypothetical protein
MGGCSARVGFVIMFTCTLSPRPRLRSRSSSEPSNATRPDGFTRRFLIDGPSSGSTAMERLQSAALTMQPCETISATRNTITGNGRLQASFCLYWTDMELSTIWLTRSIDDRVYPWPFRPAGRRRHETVVGLVRMPGSKDGVHRRLKPDGVSAVRRGRQHHRDRGGPPSWAARNREGYRVNSCRRSLVIRRRTEPSSTRSPTRTMAPPRISGSTR